MLLAYHIPFIRQFQMSRNYLESSKQTVNTNLAGKKKKKVVKETEVLCSDVDWSQWRRSKWNNQTEFIA